MELPWQEALGMQRVQEPQATPFKVQHMTPLTCPSPFSLPLSQPFGEHTWIESGWCWIPGSPTLTLLVAERIGDGWGVG